MKIKLAEAVEANVVEMEGASGVTMRVLIGPDDGAPNFNMRLFEVAPGGHTPSHRHAWEHEVYVLGGQGVIRAPGGDAEIAPAHCAFVPAEELHQFVNTGSDVLRFLCLVPGDSG
jgi:quercetin dioxygenase-like cupin family protein